MFFDTTDLKKIKQNTCLKNPGKSKEETFNAKGYRPILIGTSQNSILKGR